MYIQNTLFGKERRLLQKKQLNPDTIKALQDAGVDIPADALEKAGGVAKAQETVQAEQKNTQAKTNELVGETIKDEESPDLRPPQPKTAPSTYRHLERAKQSLPSVGEVGKTAATVGTVLVPPAALAVAAGIGVTNLVQRIRGVPKEQRVGLSSGVQEGLRSTGRTVLAPFTAGFNMARFAVEGAGKVLSPIRKLNRFLTYKGMNSKKHLLAEGVKLPFKVIFGTLKLGRDLILKVPDILKSIVNDFDKHPIFSAIGLTIAAGGAIAVTTNPAAVGAATIGIVDGVGKLIAFLPDALQWLLNMKSVIPTP